MIKLTVGNSMSRVEGLDITQLKALRALTSYSIDPKAAYFSGSSYNLTRHLMDKRGNFPTGLLYIVEKYLFHKMFLLKDLRTLPDSRYGLFEMKLDLTPYPEQMEAAEAAKLKKRGVISATTGTGKSLIAALIVQKLQVPTLIVVPSLELKRQLTETMVAYFGTERVGGLGAALAIENVDALDFKKPLKGYDCVIIDEFHHSGAKTYRELNKKAWNDIYYRFGLTATPFRSQDHERLLLESVLSEVVYTLSYTKSVEKGYIVPVEAYYVDLVKKDTDAYTWPQVYAELVTKNEQRNNIITELLLKFHAKKLATLCLVREIQHGRSIQRLLSVANNPHEFATGEDDSTSDFIKDFNDGHVSGLIGTTGVLGEGVDTKPAEYIIIAGLGKSKNQFMQQVGRGLRKYPGKTSCKIILFRDPSHKFTLSHFNAQKKILLDEYGVKVVRLEI